MDSGLRPRNDWWKGPRQETYITRASASNAPNQPCACRRFLPPISISKRSKEPDGGTVSSPRFRETHHGKAGSEGKACGGEAAGTNGGAQAGAAAERLGGRYRQRGGRL